MRSLCSLLGSVGFDDLDGDSVHVGGSSLGEGLSVDGHGSVGVFVLELSDELVLLELHEAVSDALSSDESGVLGSDTSSLLSGVVLSEGVDSDFLSHVKLVADGGSSSVKPVSVIGSEILGTGGLVVGGPLNVKIINILI